VKNEEKKKGFLGFLQVGKKDKKGSGCCSLEFEEIQEDTEEQLKEKEMQKNTKNSCCG